MSNHVCCPKAHSKAEAYKSQIQKLWKTRCGCCLEKHPHRVKQDLDRGFILLLLQTALLPESDAGSDAFLQHRVSSFRIVRPRAFSCDTRCMGTLLGRGPLFAQGRRT